MPTVNIKLTTQLATSAKFKLPKLPILSHKPNFIQLVTLGRAVCFRYECRNAVNVNSHRHITVYPVQVASGYAAILLCVLYRHFGCTSLIHRAVEILQQSSVQQQWSQHTTLSTSQSSCLVLLCAYICHLQISHITQHIIYQLCDSIM